MNADPDEINLQVQRLLQQGNDTAARALLARFIQENPNSEEGWMLLSEVVDNPAQKADCLRQALRINPTNRLARWQLEEIQAEAARSKVAGQKPPSAIPGPIPSKVYVAQMPSEPGLDFWEEDDSENLAPPAKILPVAPPREIRRPATVSTGKPLPASSPPHNVSTFQQSNVPTTGKDTPPAQQTPAPAPTAVKTPSFAPGQPGASPDEADLGAIPSPLYPGRDSEKQPSGQPIPQHPRRVNRQVAAAHGEQPPQKKPYNFVPLVIVGIVLVIMTVAVIASVLVIQNLTASNNQPSAPAVVQNEPGVTASAASETPIFVLPASWTPTATSTATPQPTITATPLPSATPTLAPPPPAVLALIEAIQSDVSELRGLPALAQVPTHLVPPLLAQKALASEFLNEETLQRLSHEGIGLSALGLIEPSYNLANFTLNKLVDHFGGMYHAEAQRIYILGWDFTAAERYTYAHEFTHALIDQYFDLGNLEEQGCANEDQCQAVHALIQGDATLAMNQWLARYASESDQRLLKRFRFPDQAFPEPSPPDYVLQSLNFPYQYGAAFVESLFNESAWERVNQAYSRLPQSTEQIMHPEKYSLAEAPLPLQDTPLLAVLNQSWRMLKTNTLGEWLTFLTLAYGVDESTRQPAADAALAASGWGGDQYQLYYNQEANQTVLAVHWAWDSEQDALEFDAAMRLYLKARFRDSFLPRPAGSCWQSISQTTCFYSRGNESLWLLTPDEATLELALSLYPSFASP